jgi:hypothetical protein
MSLLLLGLDSLIVCLAIGPVVEKGSRVKLAALFGAADGIAFLVGAGFGLRLLSDRASTVLTTGLLVAMGLYLLVVAAGTQQVTARWPVWVLPFALIFDNLTYGLVGDHAAGSLFSQAGQQALSSATLAFVGLVAGALIPVVQRRVDANRIAGGALLLAAGALVLVG